MRVGSCKTDKSGILIDIHREYWSQGWIFKDTEAFELSYYLPCYVPGLLDKAYATAFTDGLLAIE